MAPSPLLSEYHKHSTGAATIAATQAPSRSQFLELPTELRLLIYDFVYATDYRPAIYIYGNSTKKGRLTNRGPQGGARPCLLGLPQTCKAIYKEALPVLYRTQSFHVQVLRSWAADTSFPMTVIRSWAFTKYIKKVDMSVYARTHEEIASVAEGLKMFCEVFEGTIDREIRLHLGVKPGPGCGDSVYKALMAARLGEDVTLYHALQGTVPSFASTSVWQDFRERFEGTSAEMPFNGRFP
ncbi:hypothetical protein LTR17_001989 [Elasticomyces elasticus]|nr:hypothetical protein LTR17_001989 [Elasticomyces elasticus]